jgi:protein-S-isoprenylcysteine O-methyltransferase Ste14
MAAAMLLGALASYAYRIEVEEAALGAALGEAYVRFKHSRPRMIPFVY